MVKGKKGMEDQIFNSGNWDDSAEEQKAIGSTNFKTLEEGDNVVRILGQYIFRNMHYVPEGQRRYIVCCGENCPLCAKGDMPKLSYYVNVLDRDDADTIKILRFGISVKRKIQNLISKYGDVANYDIIITRTGKGLDTSYEILPSRSDEELSKEVRDKILTDFIDLNEAIPIPSPEEAANDMQPADDSDGGNNAAKVEVDENKKACFGKKYNPINPECQSCDLAENCKSLVIQLFSKDN